LIEAKVALGDVCCHPIQADKAIAKLQFLLGRLGIYLHVCTTGALTEEVFTEASIQVVGCRFIKDLDEGRTVQCQCCKSTYRVE